MMKKVWMAIALAMVVLSSCTFKYHWRKTVVCEGEVMDRNMELTGFDRIVVNGSADMKYVQANSDGVIVTANEDVFPYLKFRVDDRVLYLETVDSVQIRAEKFEVHVASSSLKSITVNGAADATIGALDADEDLVITVNGAGDVEMKNIRVPRLDFTVNGAGDLEASGLKVGKLYVSVHGAGDIDLAGEADYASLSVSGAGDINAVDLNCPEIEKSKSGVASIRTR